MTTPAERAMADEADLLQIGIEADWNELSTEDKNCLAGAYLAASTVPVLVSDYGDQGVHARDCLVDYLFARDSIEEASTGLRLLHALRALAWDAAEEPFDDAQYSRIPPDREYERD